MKIGAMPTTATRARRETRAAFATRLYVQWRAQGVPAILDREDAADLLGVQGVSDHLLPEGDSIPLSYVAVIAASRR